MYQHDSARVFRFVLRGALEGRWVQELEGAWITATSVLKRKDLEVDASGLTRIDENGVQLLSRMRESGARLTAASLVESPGLACLIGIPEARPTSRNHGLRTRRWKFLSLAVLLRGVTTFGRIWRHQPSAARATRQVS